MGRKKKRAHELVEPLWDAKKVGEFLSLPEKSVYQLKIPRIELGPRRVRWAPAVVRQWAMARQAS